MQPSNVQPTAIDADRVAVSRDTRGATLITYLAGGTIMVALLAVAMRNDGGPTSPSRDPLANSYAARYAMQDSLNDPDWATSNPDRAADLRQRGIPYDHYRSILNVAMVFSSDAGDGLAAPGPLVDLPPHFRGAKTFTRPGHEAMGEAIWKFRLVPARPSSLLVADHHGPCGPRVFAALMKEWTGAVVYFKGDAATDLMSTGVSVILDVQHGGEPDRFLNTHETYTATGSTASYDITVDATSSVQLDDQDQPIGEACFTHLYLQVNQQTAG